MTRGVKVREPESIDAPPQSSDDEEDYRHLQDSDDDDDDENGRGDIKPTTFRSGQSSFTLTDGARRSTRERSKPSSQNDEPSSSAGSKRFAEEPLSEAGSHLTNAYGFSKKNKRTKGAATYGNKSSQPRSSQPKSSQKSTLRSSTKSPPGKTFKHPSPIPSPERTRSPSRRFIKPNNLSPEKTRPSKAFKPPPLADSSPSQDKPTFRHGSLPSDASPAKSKLKLFDVDEESDTPTQKKPTRQSTKTERSRKSKARAQRGPPKPKSEESSQRPAFKVHSLDDLDYLDDSDDKVIVAFENHVSDDELGDVGNESTVATTARCPMCHEVVDSELLAKHSDHGRMNIRKQAAFCRLHKRQTALSARSQKGYPKIDWGALDTRLEKHQDLLKDILEGTRQSHYREVLRENVESGKNRTLLKTDDSLTPGYYGPRGLRAMTEYIMRTLSSVVRKRAVEDRLVSARGYTGYVQVVLVPELAVRLIMEDMSVTEEEARKVMQDSIEFGELLHEDIGDVIAGVSDEEEEGI